MSKKIIWISRWSDLKLLAGVDLFYWTPFQNKIEHETNWALFNKEGALVVDHFLWLTQGVVAPPLELQSKVRDLSLFIVKSPLISRELLEYFCQLFGLDGGVELISAAKAEVPYTYGMGKWEEENFKNNLKASLRDGRRVLLITERLEFFKSKIEKLKSLGERVLECRSESLDASYLSPMPFYQFVVSSELCGLKAMGEGEWDDVFIDFKSSLIMPSTWKNSLCSQVRIHGRENLKLLSSCDLKQILRRWHLKLTLDY